MNTSVSELDSELATLAARAEAQRQVAEDAMTQLVDYIADAACGWIPTAVKEMVIKHEGVTEKLVAQNRLGEMKELIRARQTGFSSVMKSGLASDRLWPHRPGYVDDSSRSPADRGAVYRPLQRPHAASNPPHQLATAASASVEAAFGAILIKYGYPRFEHGAKQCLGHNFHIPAGFLPLLTTYSEANAELHVTLKQRDAANKQRAKLRAAEEWDKQ